MEKTFHQQLIYAVTAEPQKASMWVEGVGNPHKKHKRIIDMYVAFMDFCDKNQVKAWLLFGSLIGYVRHHGVIPWEWDMDVGVSSNDYQTLLRFQSEYSNSDWEFAFYEDPPTVGYKGYPGESYCFRSKTDPGLLVDIGEYKEHEGNLVPVTPDGYYDYETYRIEDIYPLKRTTLLGCGTWIPHKVEAVLNWYGDISWYDPVPFILSRFFNPIHLERLCTPATRLVAEAVSLADGIERFGSKGRPFVVRGLKGIELNLAEIDISLMGWNALGEEVEGVSSRDAIKAWKEGTLKLNYIDSPAPYITRLDHCELGQYVSQDSLMFVLSNKNHYTGFHCDPAVDYKDIKGRHQQGGGGWMYVHEGQKVWQLLSPEYLAHLYNPDTGMIDDMGISDLLYHKDHVLWGTLEETHLERNDFLYFPPGYLHRVWTYEATHGLGGYLNFEESKVFAEKSLALLQNLSIDTDKYPGVWIDSYNAPPAS